MEQKQQHKGSLNYHSVGSLRNSSAPPVAYLAIKFLSLNFKIKSLPLVLRRCFQGTKMVLHALRPVQPGEMVGENYGPIYSKKSFGERQKALRARYWFDCAYQACSEKWNTFDKGIKSKV
jgi:hypothetical protein